MQKDDLTVHVFQGKNWYSPKSAGWFVFLTLTVRGPFYRKDFKWKKLTSKKTGALYAEFNKRAEAATSSYPVTGNFLQYIYFVLVTKNHQNIRSRCLVHGYRAAISK